jgi:hypothetical protein
MHDTTVHCANSTVPGCATDFICTDRVSKHFSDIDTQCIAKCNSNLNANGFSFTKSCLSGRVQHRLWHMPKWLHVAVPGGIVSPAGSNKHCSAIVGSNACAHCPPNAYPHCKPDGSAFCGANDDAHNRRNKSTVRSAQHHSDRCTKHYTHSDAKPHSEPHSISGTHTLSDIRTVISALNPRHSNTHI